MRILVTGATGFLGHAIALRLTEMGHHVIGASRRPSPDMRSRYLDITSRENCNRLLSECGEIGAVVHCAALAHIKHSAAPDGHYRAINAEGTRNMLEAALSSHVKQFIFISSVAVYGEFDLPIPVAESHPARPLGSYAITKKMAEDYCLARQNGIDVYILRMATMYSKQWVLNIRKRVSLPVIGKFCYLTFKPKERRYSLCSSRNGAEAVNWAIGRHLSPGIYNVADNHHYCQEDILNVIKRIEGKKLLLPIPEILTIAGFKVTECILSRRLRENIYRQYWKFCKHNLISTDKIIASGFRAHPELLEMAEGRR